MLECGKIDGRLIVSGIKDDILQLWMRLNMSLEEGRNLFKVRKIKKDMKIQEIITKYGRFQVSFWGNKSSGAKQTMKTGIIDWKSSQDKLIMFTSINTR